MVIRRCDTSMIGRLTVLALRFSKVCGLLVDVVMRSMGQRAEDFVFIVISVIDQIETFDWSTQMYRNASISRVGLRQRSDCVGTETKNKTQLKPL